MAAGAAIDEGAIAGVDEDGTDEGGKDAIARSDGIEEGATAGVDEVTRMALMKVARMRVPG